MENNRSDDSGFWAQKTRCLKKISELCKRLEEQKSQYPNLCENYLKILDGIEKAVSRTPSRNTLDKCEDELNRYWNVISSNFSTTREGETLPHSRSPDSTAAYGNSVNITSGSGRYVYDHQKADNTSDYQPDSTTLIEGPSGDSSNNLNISDEDSEVSSSQESTKRDSVHIPDGTFPSLYSRRKDNCVEVGKPSKENDDPVTMIMNTVKNRLHHDMLNHSSHLNYGMTSSEEIERYEGTLKSQFFENVDRTTHGENKLSSMLEKLMVGRDCSSISEKPNASNVSTEQKTEKPLSLREKMAQDIGTLHKAGESNKIKGSLKQLKSDISPSNSSKLDPAISRSDDRVSMSSPNDVDDYRSIRTSELRRYSDRYPRSPRSPLSFSGRSNRESPHAYFSPKDSPDDHHRSDRRRRSRSRSRERYRDQYSEKSSNNKTSPKQSTITNSQSTSYNSFVSSIGYGRCPPSETKEDENRRKEDKNKNDFDGLKPNNIRVKKKNFAKFKVNTNLSGNIVEQNIGGGPAKVEPTPTANHSDIPPLLACSESSSSSGVMPHLVPRLPKANNYYDKRDGFTKVTIADPRLQNQMNKNSDPRNGRYTFQKTGVPKDPRPPSSASTTVTKGSDEFHSRIATQPPEVRVAHVPRIADATFSKDSRIPTASILPVNKEIHDKFRSRTGIQPQESNVPKGSRNPSSHISIIPQENKFSYSSHVPDRAKPPPSKPKWQQNKFGNNNFKSSTEGKRNTNQNVFRETKTPKSMSRTDIKQQVKNSNQFLSPLQDIFQTSEVVKTGRGYGDQKQKKNAQKPTLKNFTIPKIRKQSDEADKIANVNNDEDWNVVLNNAMTENLSENSFVKRSKKKIFHDDDDDDDENWNSAISNDDKADTTTTTQLGSSLPSDDIANNTNDKHHESTEPVPMDIATEDDVEECWDPVDSPEVLVVEADMSKNVAEITQKETIAIEIDDIEDLTQDKNDEIIVIDNSDKPTNAEKESSIDCIRRRTSSDVRIDEVYSLENNDRSELTLIRDRARGGEEPESMDISDCQNSPKHSLEQHGARSPTTSDLPTPNSDLTEKNQSSVAETDRDSSKQDAPPPPADVSNESTDELLMTKVLQYLKSITNPPEILEKDVKLSPNEFIIKLFPQMSLQTFKAVQDIIANHEDPNKNESEEVPVVEEVSKQPTDDEMNPPIKPGRGRRKGRKANTKSELDLKTIAEPKTKTNLNPTKKRNRELDRLHADIEKLRQTKNNVMDIGTTRRCRLQPANYIDTKVYNRRSMEECTSPAQFENETSKGRKSGICRTRSKADLGSDSDSGSSNKRFKSRQFVLSDTSSDEDSEKGNTSSSTHDDIRKYKACPRHVKIERFGSACYELFEKTELKRDLLHMKKTYCPKHPIPVLPKVPNTCDNFISCVCHSAVPSSDAKPECSKDIESESVSAAYSKTDEKPAKVQKVQARNYRKSPKKRKAKLGKTSQLRMKMSKNVHCPNWQVVKDQVRNQKGADQKDKMNENSAVMLDDITESAEIPDSDSRVSSFTSECVDDLSTAATKDNRISKDTTTDDDDDLNDDLKNLPAYNAFKNPNVTTINIATIGVRLDSTLVYVCKTDECSYESDKIDMFALHITFLHRACEINATCKLCENARNYLNLKSAFRHLLKKHLQFIPDPVPPPTSTNVQIKEEPVDSTLTIHVLDDDSTNESHVVTEPTVPAVLPVPDVAKLATLRTESVSTQPPIVISSAQSSPALPAVQPASDMAKSSTLRPESVLTAPPKVMPSAQSSPVLKNPPKIRVRRLSGDKLSGLETSSDSQRSTPEIRNITAQNTGTQSELCNFLLSNDTNLAVNFEKDTSTVRSDIEESVDVDQIQIVDDILSDAVTELDLLPYNFTKAELNLIHFYKCPDKICGFSSDVKKEFLSHLHNIHKGLKRNRKFDAAFLTCRYCSKKFDTPEMLVIHMEKYENCKFQCAYCEFRASRPVYLLWHLNACHFGQTIKILVSSVDDNKDDFTARLDAEKDLKEVVAPITCVHCDKFRTFSFIEYKNHWKKNHSQTDSVVCDLCKSRYFSLDLGVKHLTSHGYGEFQCVYCIHGVASEEAIKSHLLKEHYTLYPKAVKRITPANPETANKFGDYIEILDLDQPFNDLKKHFRLVDKNRATEVTLHAETPDGTISATVNLNEVTEDAGDSNYDDVIAVCSSDDDTIDRLVINEDAPTASSSKTVSKHTYSNGLSGTDLYKCGFIGCTAAFETYVPFKEHLSICDNARNRTSPKCPHCNRTFQKNAAFLTHIGLHSIPRYICSLCDNRFTTAKKGEDHVKQIHKMNSFKVIPANPLKDNSHEDLYIVLPNSEKGGGKGNKQYKKFIDSKNLPSTSTATSAKSKEAADSLAKQIITVYSLRDVEEYLPMQLFSEPVTCGICSTYNSKVRQNIIVHLQDHSTGLVPVNDITNPVPCTDKSELMFNKMTNHAAFSAKADDRKIKCLIEVSTLNRET